MAKLEVVSRNGCVIGQHYDFGKPLMLECFDSAQKNCGEKLFRGGTCLKYIKSDDIYLFTGIPMYEINSYQFFVAWVLEKKTISIYKPQLTLVKK